MSANTPAKVYIMLGQSNMLGFGRIEPQDQEGTLMNLVHHQDKYKHHLGEGEGRWREVPSVRFVQTMHKNGKGHIQRNEWLTVKGKHLGPELELGHVLAEKMGPEQPIMLLKSCIGNRSLGWDLLPPSSEQYEYEGKVYAGYKDSPDAWEIGTTPEKIAWYAGKQYDDDVASAKEILQDFEKYYPSNAEAGYEIAGFVFWQGHKDSGNPAHVSRYELNLANMIRALRNDFEAPEAKFVLATVGFDGIEEGTPMMEIFKAQFAVEEYDEFKGNVKCIDARPHWRDATASPSKQGHHYNHNAETYLEVGNALGQAIVDLM